MDCLGKAGSQPECRGLSRHCKEGSHQQTPAIESSLDGDREHRGDTGDRSCGMAEPMICAKEVYTTDCKTEYQKSENPRDRNGHPQAGTTRESPKSGSERAAMKAAKETNRAGTGHREHSHGGTVDTTTR